MSYDLNNLSIVGRLTRTPSLKQTQDGQYYSKFSIANNYGNKDSDTSFFDVTIWGKSAENCYKYLEKGNLVAITGRINESIWEGKDGKTKRKVEIIANSISFISYPKNKSNSDTDENVDNDNSVEYDNVDDVGIPF